MSSAVRDSEFRSVPQDLARVFQMVLAAQDFGLPRAEASAVARDAFDRPGFGADRLEAVAGALAERLLKNLREGRFSAQRGPA